MGTTPGYNLHLWDVSFSNNLIMATRLNKTVTQSLDPILISILQLGQHMKLNIQPSVWSSPSKGNLHVITPPSSPYTAHQEPQNSINTSRTWNSSPQRVPQATTHSTLWYKDKNQPSERWNPLRLLFYVLIYKLILQHIYMCVCVYIYIYIYIYIYKRICIQM